MSGLTASVIVPTFRRRAALLETLNALSRQDASDFEIVVVVDGPDPDVRQDARRLALKPPVRWIFHEENRGLPAARNTGVRASDTQLILFLDDDVLPAAEWLGVLRARHELEGPRTIVGARLLEEHSSPASSRVERMLRERRALGLRRFHERSIRNGGTFEFAPHCGNNSSLLRATFDELGGFDEHQRWMHEDLEMGERAHARGIRFVYEPAAVAVHRNHSPAYTYDVQSPAAEALSDLYRVRDKSQRTDRTARIVSMERGPFGRRMRQSLAWTAPSATMAAGKALIRAAEATGSQAALTVGRSLQMSVRYWGALKERGESRQSLALLDVAPMPAFVIHSVGRDGAAPRGEERRYHIGEHRFRTFMKKLSRWEIRTVPPSALSGGNVRKPLLLTFDDGYEDFYTTAFPILAEHRLTACLYVVAGSIGGRNEWDVREGARSRRLLTRDQIVELHRHGVIIGSHSVTHARLTTLEPSELEREVVDSKSILEDIIGSPVHSFAYPSGQVSERVRAAVAAAGYHTAVTTQEGLNSWTDPLLLRRTPLSDIDSALSFRLKIATGRSAAGHVREATVSAARTLLGVLPPAISLPVSQRLKEMDADRRRALWMARARAMAAGPHGGDAD